jgi:hypothetical protein
MLCQRRGREQSTGVAGLAGEWQTHAYPRADAQASALRACQMSNRCPGPSAQTGHARPLLGLAAGATARS